MKTRGADGGLDEFLYLRFADLLYLPDALSFHPLGEERRGGDGESATRTFKGDVFDDTFHDTEMEREAVPAERIRDRGGVGRFLQCAEIQRMPVVLQYLLAVHVVSVGHMRHFLCIARSAVIARSISSTVLYIPRLMRSDASGTRALCKISAQ